MYNFCWNLGTRSLKGKISEIVHWPSNWFWSTNVLLKGLQGLSTNQVNWNKPKQFWNTFDIQLEFAMLIRYLIQENLGIADSLITENKTGSQALEKVFWTWLSVIQVIPLCWLVNYVGNSWFLSTAFRWSPACCTPCKRFWTRVCKVWLGLQTLSCLIFTNKSWHQ